jgi:hypothetical protein
MCQPADPTDKTSDSADHPAAAIRSRVNHDEIVIAPVQRRSPKMPDPRTCPRAQRRGFARSVCDALAVQRLE